MKKLIIAIAMFMTLTSVNIKPHTLIKKSLVEYKQVQIGKKIIFVENKVSSLDSITIKKLLPEEKKSLLPKELCPKFKDEMGSLESNGNYYIVNQLGYIGKYQFSRRTLRRLVKKGYLDITKEEMKNFRTLPHIQERAMDALINANLQTLRNYRLQKYVGRTVGGVKVTMEGMLAASHLLGPYAVSHYMKNGGSMKTVYVNKVKVSKYDANGTSLKKYLRHFV